MLNIWICKNHQESYSFELVNISGDETLENLKKTIYQKLAVPNEFNEFSLCFLDNQERVWKPIEESSPSKKLSDYNLPRPISIILEKKKLNLQKTSTFSENTHDLTLKLYTREFDESDYVYIRMKSSETMSQLCERASKLLNNTNLGCLFRFNKDRWIKLDKKLESYKLEIFNFTPYETIAFSLTSDRYTPGLCGLTNLGSTCFINSPLQCLSNIPKFTEEILSMDEHVMNAPIIGSYVQLMKQIWSGNYSSVTPSIFISIVRENLPRFISYRQYDAQEFLNELLRLIHSELTNEHTLISKLFYGTLRSRVTCLNNCKSTEITDETFSFIPLPVDNNMNRYRIFYLQANGCVQGIVTVRVRGTTIGDLIDSFINQHAKNLKFSQINAFRIRKNRIVEEYRSSDRLYWIKKDELTLIEKPEISNRQTYTELVFLDENTNEPFRPPLFLVRPTTDCNYSDLIQQINMIRSNLFPNDKEESLRCKLYYENYAKQGVRLQSESDDQYYLSHSSKILMIVHQSLVLKYKETNNFEGVSEEPKPSLNELLVDFFQERSLCGDYLCSNCGKLVQAKQKSILVEPLPPVMIIQLKRFTFEVNSNEKIDTYIKFPLQNLDFTPFIEPTTATKSNLYDLVAVSNHIGNLASGHYFTYAKNKIDQKWYDFNDSSPPTMLDNNSVVTKNAYILIYSKKE